MDGEKIVKPFVHPSEILANPRIIPDSPGCTVLEYMASIMTSDNRYWGPFVTQSDTLDQKIVNKIKDENFVKGRIFIENIHLRYKGLELMGNNIIIEFVR